jgi:hypothetical protein
MRKKCNLNGVAVLYILKSCNVISSIKIELGDYQFISIRFRRKKLFIRNVEALSMKTKEPKILYIICSILKTLVNKINKLCS